LQHHRPGRRDCP